MGLTPSRLPALGMSGKQSTTREEGAVTCDVGLPDNGAWSVSEVHVMSSHQQEASQLKGLTGSKRTDTYNDALQAGGDWRDIGLRPDSEQRP